MRRRGVNNRRRRGVNNQGGASLDYEIAFEVALPATEASYTWEPTFSALGIDSSRPLRVSRLSLDLATDKDNVVVESSLFGPPSATETTAISVRSRAKTVGVTPQRVVVVQPRVIDYYTPASNNPVFRLYITAITQGTTPAPQFTLGGTVTVQFQRRSTLTLIKAA